MQLEQREIIDRKVDFYVKQHGFKVISLDPLTIGKNDVIAELQNGEFVHIENRAKTTQPYQRPQTNIDIMNDRLYINEGIVITS